MKRFSLAHLFLLAVVTLFLAYSPADAATQVATVVAARGDVQALDAKGKARALSVQSPIFEDDTLRTGERSRVQIMFTDNTLVSLGTATTMKIAEYRWQPDQKDGALKTRIKEGTFRVMGGALTKTAPQNFKTETPTATIGIRGSMYAGVATADFLSVVFQGGKGIEITNPFGTVEISKPGYGTKVALDKPPLPPMKFTAQELGELNKALGGNGNGAEEKKEKKEEKETKKEGSSTKEEKADKKEEKKSEEKGAAPKEKQAAATTTTTTETTGTTTTESTAAASSEPTTMSTTSETTTATSPAAEPVPTTTAPTAATDTTALGSWGSITTIDPVAETTPVLATIPLTAVSLVSVVPTDLATDVVADTTQTDLVATVSNTATTTAASSVSLSGKYRFFKRDTSLSLSDPDDFQSTVMTYDAGTLNSTILSSGSIYGTMSNGKSFGPYQITGYTPGIGSYVGYNTFTNAISYLDDTLGTLSLTATTTADPSGQFFYSTLYHTVDWTPDYLLGSLLYAGSPTPSANIPTTGINTYTGNLTFNNHSTSYPDAALEPVSIAVNYYNNRLIGRSYDTHAGVTKYNDAAIFFGTGGSSGTANVTILAGSDTDYYAGTAVTFSYGSATATLYGDYFQGIGFTASGADYSLVDDTLRSTWDATGAAMRAVATGASPSAAANYAGFVVGVGDNTATGYVSRIFMNSNANNFTMAIDPLSGVVSGTINADEIYDSGTPLNLTVGGNTSNSAYINNDNMVALLTSSSHTLRSYGNFLYTAGPDAPKITNASTDYMTWGYWETAYTDPGLDASKDHLFSSQSFFVAGQRTPTAYLDAVMNTAVTGTYNGKAYGVQLDATGQNASQLTNGATHLVINFQNLASADAVTGTIGFDQASLTIKSAASTLTNTGFTAYVSDVSGTAPTASAVNGAFYGTPAALGDSPLAVGGNFHAQMGTGVRYLGVFGANR